WPAPGRRTHSALGLRAGPRPHAGRGGPGRPDGFGDVRSYERSLASDVAPGEIDELWVRPQDPRLVMRGYHSLPDKTAERLVDGWMYTGHGDRAPPGAAGDLGQAVIKRLLVANRGEVAVRIMATAAVLGIETVAVYPADDAACAHVSRADRAVELPGTGPAAYLDVDVVIAAAVGAGCDTLHPGYGFLAERPELAARCAPAGGRFVGPGLGAAPPFGDKTAARSRARELGVPVLAGTDGGTSPDSISLDRARALLREHGAVMVKALAGAGGRGLRPVTREADLAGAMRRCASEAAAAFGDGAVYVEQLLAPARHIEVQVIGDGTGAVAVLGDRDCSLQRRRQKLVEIAPAMIGDAIRARLSEAAGALVGS